MDSIPKRPNEFWITNKSNTNVSLSDLAFTVPAYKSYNLLDSRHFHYTWEQIYKSATLGSIHKKRHKIAIRKFSPIVNKNITKKVSDESAVPNRSKSIFEIKEEKFEELSLTDEEFAEQNADSF